MFTGLFVIKLHKLHDYEAVKPQDQGKVVPHCDSDLFLCNSSDQVVRRSVMNYNLNRKNIQYKAIQMQFFISDFETGYF